MTGATLVRYTGPLAAYRGAIGWSADGGAIISGRRVKGATEPPAYQMSRDGIDGIRWETWSGALSEIAAWLDDGSPNLAREVRCRAPSAEGLEVTDGEHVYRLTVV